MKLISYYFNFMVNKHNITFHFLNLFSLTISSNNGMNERSNN